VLTAGLIISGVGCTKKIDEFGDINVNPNIAAAPNTRGLLSNVLQAWAQRLGQ